MASVVLERLLVMQLSLLMLAAATTTTLLAAAQTLAPPQTKSGCNEKCGDLTIPYPFGIGENCSMRPEFTINCDQYSANFTNSTFTFPISITNFSLDVGELQVMQAIARNCYDDKGVQTINSESSLELPPPYTISTKNNFFTLGCNVLAAYQQDVDADYQTGVTVTLCQDILGKEIPESCTGFGCAQTLIPGGLQNISISMAALYSYNASDHWDSNYKCSYAFIVEEGNFTFAPKTSFEQLNTTIQKLPLAVNWAIGEESCEISKNLTNYSCKENGICVDRSTITDGTVGYICRCLPGYEGNPYLGCQDIDECKTSIRDPCNDGTCVNLPGNYSCKCNKGFRNQDPMTCIAYSSSNNTSLKFSLGVSLGFLVLVVVVSWIHCLMSKRRIIKLKEKYFEENGGLTLQQHLASRREGVDTTKFFTAEELEKATNNYHESRVLGEGGYGTVYKGILQEDKVVAIKKSKVGARTQSDHFVNEVLFLSQINHKNVVRLLGCCFETEVPLLVYEYITHGTLFEHLFNDKKGEGSSLSWELRLKIASETAGALAYLHSSISTPIIHRDVKTTNILLDENYTAKVSDFGASRFIPLDETQVATLVQGTMGYLDPEYLLSNTLTAKSDVYSFGVVLAELLTSKRAISFARPESERSLANFFVSSIEKQCLIQILDVDMVNEGSVEMVEQVAILAKRCLEVKGEERPTMKEVAAELEGIRITAKHPWRNVDFCPGETVYLLGSPNADTRGESYGVSSGSASRYASMQIELLKSFDDGR